MTEERLKQIEAAVAKGLDLPPDTARELLDELRRLRRRETPVDSPALREARAAAAQKAGK